MGAKKKETKKVIAKKATKKGAPKKATTRRKSTAKKQAQITEKFDAPGIQERLLGAIEVGVRIHRRAWLGARSAIRRVRWIFRREPELFRAEILRQRRRILWCPDTPRRAFVEAMSKESYLVWGRSTRAQSRTPPLEKNERAALTILYPKISAILFGRVWAPVAGWTPTIPAELLFSVDKDCPAIEVGTELEVLASTGMRDFTKRDLEAWVSENSERFETKLARGVEYLERHTSASVVPAFGTAGGFFSACEGGKRRALVASLDRLQIIDEAKVHWGQVLEIRRDEERLRAVHRFVSWADGALAELSRSEFEQKLGQMHEDYLDALAAHGIETSWGVMNAVLKLGQVGLVDPDSLAGTTLSLASTALDIRETAVGWHAGRRGPKESLIGVFMKLT